MYIKLLYGLNSSTPLNVTTHMFIRPFHQFNFYYEFMITHLKITLVVAFQIIAGKEKKKGRGTMMIMMTLKWCEGEFGSLFDPV